MENKGLLVRHFNDLPSPAEFAQIEDANVPAIFQGCVRRWPAYNLWNPSKGGLQRLKHLAGSATVQVMATTSGSNFYGDIRGHERVPIQFQSFLDLADRSRAADKFQSKEGFAFLESHDVQLYLAQAGIFSEESATPLPLSSLREDVDVPGFLQSPVFAMNLWMSVNGSRSSTHYDPFHNLLCIVSGCKEVKLWPPSAAPSLYPLPIFGEASNHSGVDFANPDLTKYPRFLSAMRSYQSVTLHAGDALFLPEGWYHQVDSEAITIAVNLWWPSKISLKLGSHMDAYLLRRLLANLLDSEKEQIIQDFRRLAGDVAVGKAESKLRGGDKCGAANGEGKCREFVERGATTDVQEGQERSAILESPTRSKHKPKRDRRRSKRVMKVELAEDLVGDDKTNSALGSSSKLAKDSRSAEDAEGGDSKSSPGQILPHQKLCVKKLAGSEVQALRTLILSVSDSTKGTMDTDATLEDSETQDQGRGDTIARIFSSLDPPSLQRTLLVMSIDYPRTFEALILHKLSPMASEILTRKFEEMDESSELDSPQEEFYTQIYSVFDNPSLAMASLVDGKESFAAMALKRVLDGNLGLSCIPVHAGPP